MSVRPERFGALLYHFGTRRLSFLKDPKLLTVVNALADEPTANLDGAAREAVIALIPTLTAAGCSVVMACHDRDLIGLPGVGRGRLRDGRIEYR